MFVALSAVPVGSLSTLTSDGNSCEVRDGLMEATGTDDHLVLELPPLPRRGAAVGESDGPAIAPVRSTRERRRRLRELNAARAADLVRFANLSHAKVNTELNRLAGIGRITEASEEQLERRLAAAERWLRS